jgi:hypothetical protein
MRTVLVLGLLLLGSLLQSSGASAQQAAPSPSASASAGDKVWSPCTEYIPKGATRPKLTANLPARGLSGYAVRLTVTVTHGRGETVMPGGFRIQRGSDAMRALRETGWVIPEPDGGAAPLIDRPDAEKATGTVTTSLTLPFVPLPEEPGRHRLVLPPIPITVGRANAQVMTVCTPPQTITIDDPIANEVDPAVKGNPDPRPQREEWELARQLAIGAAATLLLALILVWLLTRYRRRPKREPPKPKVLPWIAAMQELDALRRSALLSEEKLDEYFDGVTEITRRYMGERYGFDGVESTTSEMRQLLKRVYPKVTKFDLIDTFLSEMDLIKFTDMEPTPSDCDAVMARAEAIVAGTTPPGAVNATRDTKKKKKKRKKKKRRAA